MKAMVYDNYGPADVLHLSEVPKPTPKANEILVKIAATAVNSADVRIRKADPFLVRLAFGLFRPRQKILGISLAGKVEAVGEKVTNFAVGDEIFGLTKSGTGAYAQYVSISDRSPIAYKPKNLNFLESAALPFGAHTTWDFLRKAQLSKGQTVLIYGASGAVGTALIQLAKYHGAQVTAVCGTGNLELVKSLGADAVIDYTKQDISSISTTFDLVIETVNKVEISKVANLVKKGGVLILGAGLIKEMLAARSIGKKYGIKVIVGPVDVSAEDMDTIRKLAEEGSLKPTIDKAYPLEEIPQAHAYVDTGHKKGNVVVAVE
jgi:NADPH:quinone reductase-like Zn-dependent oxidoreductase